MTRSEAYAEGAAAGWRWAEWEISRHVTREGDPRPTERRSDEGYAYSLGFARAYRDTWARWDAGTLTASMLEHAPLRAEA